MLDPTLFFFLFVWEGGGGEGGILGGSVENRLGANREDRSRASANEPGNETQGKGQVWQCYRSLPIALPIPSFELLKCS